MPESIADPTATCVVCENVFTPAELDMIERHGDGLQQGQAVLGSGAASQIRITQTAPLRANSDTKWIYDRMLAVIRQVNSQVYQYNLEGFSEAFQYTVYHGNDGGHYDWHIDWGPTPALRKLSASVQLTDPGLYDGCDLEFNGARGLEVSPRNRGAVIVFPSFIQHRVTRCTRGTRKAIVAWTAGPQFK